MSTSRGINLNRRHHTRVLGLPGSGALLPSKVEVETRRTVSRTQCHIADRTAVRGAEARPYVGVDVDGAEFVARRPHLRFGTEPVLELPVVLEGARELVDDRLLRR